MTNLRIRLILLATIAVLPVSLLGVYNALRGPLDAYFSPGMLLLSAVAGIAAAAWLAGRFIVLPAHDPHKPIADNMGEDAASRGAQSAPEQNALLTAKLQQMENTYKIRSEERDMTEAELLKTQARLVAAQRIGRIANWELDLAGTEFWCGDQVYEIFGLHLAHSPGATKISPNILYPADRDRFDVAWRDALAGTAPLDIEHRILTGTGTIRWIHELGELNTETGHTTPVLAGTMQDITDRKQAEETLRAGEERYRLLFERNPQPMWVFDSQTLKFLAINDAAITHYGYTRDEFLAMTIEELRTPEQRVALRTLLSQKDRRFVKAGAWKHRRKDGSWIDVDISSHEIQFNERPARLVLANDISDRMQGDRMQEWETRILGAISSGLPLADVLEKVVLNLEAFIPRSVAAIHLVDADGKTLLPGASPSMPASYRQVVDHLPVSALTSVCGAALHRRETVIVTDMTSDPLVAEFRALANDLNLRACWSVPVMDEAGKVIAMIAVYYHDARAPDAKELELARRKVDIIGIAVQKDAHDRALRDSRAMLDMSARVCRVGAWHLDLPDMKVTWSEGLYAMHELAPGSVHTTEDGLRYCAPEYREELTAAITDCVITGDPFDTEVEIITAKGNRLWARVMGEAVRDDTGQVVRVQGAFQDNSTLRQGLAREAQLATRLSLTVENISDAFVTFDREWRYTFVNHHAEKLLRRKRKELLGGNLWELFPEAVGTVFDMHYREAVATGRPEHFEQFYPPLDMWLDISAVPTDEGLAVYFRDVTQRRNAEAQLRLMQAAISRLNDMVVITDAEPLDEPGPRIVYVNDAFERLTGYSRDEVIGRSPRLLQGPKTQRDELDRIGNALRTWQPVRAELINYAKDGGEFWLEMDIVPISNERGWYTHWVAVERDITHRKMAAEEILNLNAQLEERVQKRTAQLLTANKDLESFSYSVSHDLRAPLRTMDGFANALQLDYGTLLPPDGLRYLARIQAAAQRMGQLIDDLLTFSRMGSQEMNYQRCDTAALVRSALETIQPHYPGREAQVHIGPLPACEGDMALLTQVWTNLISNAFKYSAKKDAPLISIGCQQRDGENVFFVRDNGAGFNMAYADKLFGVFQRLHAGRDFEGTGVGLAIVKRIIVRHGGRIWAEAVEHEAATFYFTLGQEISE